jgi:Ala-tRNA(Pro) deacylase
VKKEDVMPSDKIKDYLNSQNVKFVSIVHSPAYTAQEIAASAHIKGQELAKTVIVKLDGKMVMCVLPASHYVDFGLLKRSSGAHEALLVPEEEYKDKFPGCEPGSQPPFGNLYGMDVFVSRALTEDEKIAFNAGTFFELIQLSFADFMRLLNPKIMDFSVQAERRKAA